MKERPIIFSSEMVKVILEGKKTQTRRVIKPQPIFETLPNPSGTVINTLGYFWNGHYIEHIENLVNYCPYGQVGGKLWVREAHRIIGTTTLWHLGSTVKGAGIKYKDGVLRNIACPMGIISDLEKWHPSIHMPRWASRITLEITKVRVERLQEITEEDAIAEGITMSDRTGHYLPGNCDSARWAYRELWDSLNAKRGHPWSNNDWVWVIEFRR